MEYQCGRCKRFFSRMYSLKRHNQDECVCKLQHEHVFVTEKFDTMVDAQVFINTHEIDAAFVVSHSLDPKRIHNNNNQQIILKKYNCRIAMKKRLGENCRASLQLMKCKNHFLVIGCIKHDHPLLSNDLRISKQLREQICGLLSCGINPKSILDHYISDEETDRRPVTLQDIYRIRRSISSLNNAKHIKSDIDDFIQLQEVVEKSDNEEMLTMFSKLQYAVNNPLEGCDLLQKLAPIFDKYSFPSISKMKSKQSHIVGLP